ncbi:MAG: fumarylacetoacetate hydrolase family protein [Chloroflexota bacterium]|nr:fumarylacetoacetate hydrolase family protein [Chloroflexota bacterium]
MRLISHLDEGKERLGVEIGGRAVAATDILPGRPQTMGDVLADAGMLGQLRQALATSLIAPSVGVPVESLTLLSPVPRPGKVVAVGLNYREHAAEGGRETPPEPVLFAKFTTSIVGHGAEITWDPGLTAAVDFEAELAVVIGRTARHVKEDEALDFVLGYACLNDVSARDLQYADKQFVRAKSLDSFTPIGPALVTADEITDPQALGIRCLVNGEVMQDSSTAQMVHGVAALIAFCSRAFTLEPGDIIATGTPSGVGWFRDPKRMLQDGDEVAVEIEGVGRLVNRCREERP